MKLERRVGGSTRGDDGGVRELYNAEQRRAAPVRRGLASIALVVWLASACMLVACGGTTKGRGSGTATNLSGPALVTSSLFGMHVQQVGGSTPWPSVPVPMLRLWDSGTNWRDLESSPGAWNFTTLDTAVQRAHANGAQVILVLGMTPQWASSRPAESCPGYGNGGCAEPANLQSWRDYVTMVATRYRGRIAYYEVWNEPSIRTYYSGTVSAMVNLARDAQRVVKQIDPQAQMLTPPACCGQGIKWLTQYAAAGGNSYADVLTFHFYRFPGTPEQMYDWINQVQETINSLGLQNMPLWDTEFGWGPDSTFTSDQQEAAYVARSYLLHFTAGVKLAAWFAWDNHDWAHLQLTEFDSVTPTPAGRAYGEIQKWMVGATMSPCVQQADETWLCELTRPGGYVGHVWWGPDDSSTIEQIPPQWGAQYVHQLDGTLLSVRAGTLAIGESPVLIDNSASVPR